MWFLCPPNFELEKHTRPSGWKKTLVEYVAELQPATVKHVKSLVALRDMNVALTGIIIW